MKISYNWLKEYVDVNISPEKLAELLTMHSFEVEGVTVQGKGLENVIVGEVLEKRKHPDADKLSVVKVDVGNRDLVPVPGTKSLVLEIVCGAPNIDVGQKVPVALLGAELPCGLKIEKRKVRGVFSCGMVCAEDELGLSDNHGEIIVLDKDAKIGTPAKDVLGLDDAIFEIDILPNRAHDCLSHIGVAREVAVLLKEKLKTKNEKFDQKISKAGSKLTVKIKNENLCRRYSAVEISGIEIKESPDWLKKRLESCGVRPINNIVDITNYVMLSVGQPMHAFDADKLNGKIIVRNAEKEETIVALDENEYELEESDLVIADEKRPIAVAGVMGGLDTAVDANTKNIIFESANFESSNVRKTSQRLKLFSESSYRFEREIDCEFTIKAIDMAIEMTKKLAGGKIDEGVVDIYPDPVEPKEIEFDFGRIKNLLGIEIEKNDAIEILKSLGFEASLKDNNLKITVPTFRIDIEKVNDIIEEIGRIYGYSKIFESPALIEMKSVSQDACLSLEKELKNIFIGLGYSEVYNYSFLGEKDIIGLGMKISDNLELKNPISEELKFLRTSPLSWLLKNVRENLKYKEEFELFELGRIYHKKDNDLPYEKKVFSGVSASRGNESDFYKIKGQIELVLEKLESDKYEFKTIENPDPFWHKGRSAEIYSRGKIVGKIGEIHPIVMDNFDLDVKVAYFELYIENLAETYGDRKKFKTINKMPKVELDLSFVFDENVSWDKIKKSVIKTDNSIIKTVEPFDIYRGKNLGDNKKSIAFRVTYQAEDRTLKEEEAKEIQENIIKNLRNIGGEVRR